jgi:cytochrome c
MTHAPEVVKKRARRLLIASALAFFAAAIALGAVAIALYVTSSPARAQDATAGKTAFAQCAACHTIDDASGAGPTLKGIIGRKAGVVADFRYSRAMKSSDITWDAARLDAYLADPQKVVPGNVMPFSGIEDAKERANLVAYLQTLK